MLFISGMCSWRNTGRVLYHVQYATISLISKEKLETLKICHLLLQPHIIIWLVSIDAACFLLLFVWQKVGCFSFMQMTELLLECVCMQMYRPHQFDWTLSVYLMEFAWLSLHPWSWNHCIFLKHVLTCIWLHGIIFPEITLFIVTVIRTWNPAVLC